MSTWQRFLNNMMQQVSQLTKPSDADEKPEVSRVPCYEPNIEDVFEAKAILTKFRLPIELVDAVIDFAGYWPHTSVRRSGMNIIRSGGNNSENQFLLRSYPIGYLPSSNNPTEVEMGFGIRRHYAKVPTTYLDQEPKSWINDQDNLSPLTKHMHEKWVKDIESRGLPCRKIVFTIKAHDQGWGGGQGHKGTYNGSFTWFDVGLERMHAFDSSEISDLDIGNKGSKYFRANAEANGFPSFTLGTDRERIQCITKTKSPESKMKAVGGEQDSKPAFKHKLLPDPWCLQKNKTATTATTLHKITWSCDDNIHPDSFEADLLEEQGRGRASMMGEYVRKLKIGDVITVWGKARFPGWHSEVEEVGIDIYYAV